MASFNDVMEDWGYGIFAVIVIILLWILVPSNHKMEEEISRSYIEESLHQGAALLGMEQYSGILDLSTDDMSDEEVINKVASRGEITVKNYWLIKLGYFKANGKKKEHLAGIGFCGFVFTKSLLRSVVQK